MPKISLMEAFMVFLAIGPAANENVCLWHSADVQIALMNVRFRRNNRHDADVTRCLLMTDFVEKLFE